MAERGRAALLSLALLSGTTLAAEQDAAAEAQLLSTWSSTATRQGMRLQLKAANGQTVRFVSDHPEAQADAAGYVDYRLKGVTPDGKFFIVHGQFYESETTYWVSRATGIKTEVYDNPAVSPDGRYAMTALAREAFGPEGVFVWEIVGDRLVQRAHLKHGDYGLFTFKRWAGNDTAELALYSHSFLTLCRNAQSTTATVRIVSGLQGWTMTQPANAHDVRCE